jgi:hypothetical protein
MWNISMIIGSVGPKTLIVSSVLVGLFVFFLRLKIVLHNVRQVELLEKLPWEKVTGYPRAMIYADAAIVSIISVFILLISGCVVYLWRRNHG